MNFLLYAILAYVLYQFIFKLVIPVYLTTRKIKKGFREMNSRMPQQPNEASQSTHSTATASKAKAGDYIEFEEVK